MKMISRRERVERTNYYLTWERNDLPGAGASFPCDENGLVSTDPADWHISGLENFYECVNGLNNMHFKGIMTSISRYTIPAIGKCECGEEVYLSHFTNTCDCGRDYNMSGSLLAPREQWGEETGEHWTDCY